MAEGIASDLLPAISEADDEESEALKARGPAEPRSPATMFGHDGRREKRCVREFSF